MVIAGHAETDGAILLVVDLGVLHGIEIEVDDVVQPAHRRTHDVFKLRLVRNVDVAQDEGCEVAHHKIAGTGDLHHHFLAVLGDYLAGDELDGRHVLRDLRAEVGAIDHALVRVGVGAVDVVAVEAEGSARLHRGFQDQTHHFLHGDDAL